MGENDLVSTVRELDRALLDEESDPVPGSIKEESGLRTIYFLSSFFGQGLMSFPLSPAPSYELRSASML